MNDNPVVRLPTYGREQFREAALGTGPAHPKAIEFMDHYHEVVDECAALTERVARGDATAEVQQREIVYLKTENSKLRIERDTFLRGYEALCAQLGIIGTEALSFAAQVTKALEERKHEMLRNGIADRQEDIDAAVGDLAALIGAKHGADNPR